MEARLLENLGDASAALNHARAAAAWEQARALYAKRGMTDAADRLTERLTERLG